MSDSKIASTVVHPAAELDGIGYVVEETVWTDGGRSFDVHELDLDGDWGSCLTEAESFDEYPSDEDLRTVLPSKGAHYFIVTVADCTETQARRVMSELMSADEDYGFRYTIERDGPFQEVPKR